MGETAEGFRERARFEADRYGADPWVFVRELLQNARDAGAREVRLRVTVVDGRERLTCRDDGDGMTAEHARRFLFRLYASSKAGDQRSAGRFGIGFWSVLRFDPDLIVVRSRPRGADGWEIRLDGNLEAATERSLVMQPGTEVVLERVARDGDSRANVVAAIRADAPFLRCRDEPDEPVAVFVNGEPVRFELELPRPNVRFETPGLRGVVALAEEPRVEVFAHGLRVRSAAFLDELLLAEAGEPPSSLELPEGLLPRVVLDSDRLQVLMARGDARDDDVLRHMVGLARQELHRLVRAELDLAAPVGRMARWRERIGGAVRRHGRLAAAVAAAAAVVAVAAVAATLLQLRAPAAPRPQPTPAPTATAERPEAPFRDLSMSYTGPSVGPLAAGPAVAVRYRPPEASPLLAVLRLPGLADDGAPPAPVTGRPAASLGAPCEAGCLDLELAVSASPGLLRLPVAAGHRLDGASVRLDGRQLELLETSAGEAAVWLDEPASGVLRYRSGPSPEPGEPAPSSWPELPESVGEAIATLELLPPAERIQAAEAVIRAVIGYDRSPATGRQLRAARQRGDPVFEAAVSIGRGDCDVQNALLAALLARSGLPAVLAIGYVGADGAARPGLHAWVEVLAEGRWQVADASAGPGGEPVAPTIEEATPVAPIAPTPAPPVTQVGSEPERHGLASIWPRLALGAVGAAMALVAVAAIVGLVRRRRAPRRTLDADGGVDLARLLSGALARPDAYRDAPALFDRPLVPLIGGRKLSLRRAVAAARGGGLLRSDGVTALARRVADGGELVVDSGDPAGAAVAGLLGARDVDAWNGVAERADATVPAARAEAALRQLGGRWRLRVADRPPEQVAVVEGALLAQERGSRFVVVDRSGPLWQSIAPVAEDRPAWSSLVLAEGVADVMELDPRQRVRWLARLAREAVEEGLGGAP